VPREQPGLQRLARPGGLDLLHRAHCAARRAATVASAFPALAALAASVAAVAAVATFHAAFTSDPTPTSATAAGAAEPAANPTTAVPLLRPMGCAPVRYTVHKPVRLPGHVLRRRRPVVCAPSSQHLFVDTHIPSSRPLISQLHRLAVTNTPNRLHTL